MSSVSAAPDSSPEIAILGGTGPQGRGLAFRWAAAGRSVVIGSRDPERATRVALRIAADVAGIAGSVPPTGAHNLDAAQMARTVVLAVPYAAQRDVLQQVGAALGDKVLVTAVVPLHPPTVGEAQLPDAGSAAAEAQEQLGRATAVAAAFQNVGSGALASLDAAVDCDVLVCSDSQRATAIALDLVAAAGCVGFDAGPLQNAGVVEGLTSVLIGINVRYGADAAGIRIANVPRPRGE